MDETRRRARELRRNSTEAEKALWRHLRARPFGLRFRRQYPIPPYIVDFYCPSIRLAIEVDGDSHEWQRDYDEHRDRAIQAKGVTILRVGNDEARLDPGSVLDTLEKLLIQQRSKS